MEDTTPTTLIHTPSETFVNKEKSFAKLHTGEQKKERKERRKDTWKRVHFHLRKRRIVFKKEGTNKRRNRTKTNDSNSQERETPRTPTIQAMIFNTSESGNNPGEKGNEDITR